MSPEDAEDPAAVVKAEKAAAEAEERQNHVQVVRLYLLAKEKPVVPALAAAVKEKTLGHLKAHGNPTQAAI